MNYGSTPPISTDNTPVNGATFYEIRILQASGDALGSGVNAQIALTDSSFNASSAISYWNGNAWVSASNQQFTAPNTITSSIPASVLTDTPLMVDYSAPQPTPSPTPNTSSSATASPSTTPTSVIPEYSIVVILGLMVLLTVFVLIVRLRVRHKLVNFGSSMTAL